MKFWNTIRKIEKFSFYASLLLVGILFVVVGCVIMSMPKVEYMTTEGVIERIEIDHTTSSDEEYSVYVTYTDNTGVEHKSIRYPSYSSGMKKGKTVKVLFDPASPEHIQAPGGELVIYIVTIVGVIAIAVAVISIVKGLGQSESASPFENVEKTYDPTLVEQIKNNDEPFKEYYFHWMGKLNQSYVLETPSREAKFEANCDHIGFFTPYRYTFVNCSTGVSEEHKISHTVTTRYGNGSDSLSVSLVSSSRFKIDDVNNWEYLENLGYSVEPQRVGLKLNFEVLHCGVPVAHLEAAGVNILKDDATNPLGDKLPANGLYKVSCKDADLEAVFIACFCVSRVEFY